MTPHIQAKKGEIAKTVLMPGDPLRAKFIAEKFLDNVKQVNSVRNMFMYTGTYKGKEVTIAGSGMGQPSIGIYSFELFKFYDVDNIIRIGSAGAYKKELELYDIVLANEAQSDSTIFSENLLLEKTHIAKPSKELNEKIENSAKKQGIKINKGRIHSSDIFYSSIPLEQRIKTTQADCVEMESYALFTNAKALNKNAACLVTISDNLITKKETTPQEREQKFLKMVEVALGILED